jgi:hypothetical protein
MADNPITQALQAVKGWVTSATRPEVKEAGPGDVGPSVETKQDQSQGIQLVSKKMSEDEVKQWWQRVERSRQRRKTREEKWDILLKEYLPIISASGEPETVKVMQHFRNVHSKIGHLFYRSPDLMLEPRDPSPLNASIPNPMNPQAPPLTMEDIVTIKQAVLQSKLGRDGIKANRLMDELLFDVLAWSGIGCSKLGYRCIYRPLQDAAAPAAPVAAGAAPGGMPGSVLGDITPAAPVQPSIPVPVYEEWYWRRFSPKKALWNDDLRSTRFDEDATWTGMEFFMSPKTAMRVLKISESEASKATQDDLVFQHDGDETIKGDGLVHGVEIFLKASHFTDEVHPQVLYQLVLIEGIKDRPVVYRMSPDQEFDDQGKLTKDSLIGFPHRFLTIRDLADSSFPWADSAFTNSEVKQLSTWRRQSIQLRDAAIGKYFYDQDAFDETEVDAMQNAEVGVYIGVKGGLLAQGADKIFTTSRQVTQTQDDYRNQQIIKQDIDETLGVSAWGAGTMSETVRTATEVANVQTNMAGRNDKELDRTVDFYIDGARMIDQLLMRYADEEQYTTITGADGARRIQLWNSQIISGRYLYDIAPDSTMKVDTANDFKRLMQYWNLAAKSPITNQPYVLKRFARMIGLDPSKAVMPTPPPPPEKEDKFRATLSLNGADLSNPLVIKILVDQKIISPEDAALNQPVIKPPAGAADKADSIAAHTTSVSGNRPNEPGASNHRESMPPS